MSGCLNSCNFSIQFQLLQPDSHNVLDSLLCCTVSACW